MTAEERLKLLNQLLDELIDGINASVQSGEELNDEFQGLLAQELEATYSAIEELEEEILGAPSADAQLLWILSGQQQQAFISYLRNYPSQATQSLLNNPSALSTTIRQLTQMMPPGEPPVVNGIEHADLNSSNIWGSAYDPRTRKMMVRFQGGSEYEYDGIPPNIYRAFSAGNAEAKTKGKNRYGEWWPHKNPSLGAALNQYIKAGKFKYRKLR